MKDNIDPQIAIAAAKVIAAGDLGDGRLRATVMLSPLQSGTAPDTLCQWPSQMLRWLASRNFELQLLVQPVTFAGADGTCMTLPSAGVPIKACAAALKETWNDKSGDRSWLDSLWADAFDAKPGCADVWKNLASVIESAAMSSALSPSDTGMKNGAAAPIITVGHAPTSTAVANNDHDVKLGWIFPSNQTELSLLLEYKRAQELCNSIKYVSGHDNCLGVEINCAKIAQRKGDDDVTQEEQTLVLTTLSNDAHEQFKSAEKNAASIYSQSLCGPLSVLATKSRAPLTIAQGEQENLEDWLHAPLESFQAASRPELYEMFSENFEVPRKDCTIARDALLQTFYAIQSSPTLSRMFALTIDVSLDVSDLKLPPRSHSEDGGYFLYLALADESLCRNALPCRIHTLAKYRDRSEQFPVRHFWPASRAEASLVKAGSNLLFDLSQFDGVMIASRRVDSKDGSTTSRFEISSLDVHSASQAALDRQATKIDDAVAEQHSETASPAERHPAIARKTYVTAGILVLDRGRQQQAISQFAARVVHQRQGTAMVLDAEDLTIGYRIDVGVPIKGKMPIFAWRGLMTRTVKYGMGNDRYASQVRAVAEKLFLEPAAADDDMNWRQCIEDGSIALPARLIPRGSDDTDVDAYVEEAIAVWSGEPMGVMCAGKRSDKVKPLYGLPTGCIIGAPTGRKNAERRHPALRFGCPYRIGLRAVYAGGISVPLGVASNAYDKDRSTDFPLGGALTIPAVAAPRRNTSAMGSAQLGPIRRREQLRRFLRHERIDAPFLLLPEAIALRQNSPMGFERAAHAIVRSAHARVGERGAPTVTQRIFAMPCVSQAFATLHRAFDKFDDAKPPQGLSSRIFGPSGVRFDAKGSAKEQGGGFPIAATKYIVGFNGVPYVESRYVSADTSGPDAQGGDLIYSTGAPLGPRNGPYYPDPAAKKYAIGVRLAGTNTYLETAEGTAACVVDAYANKCTYPDARPLVITIQRDEPNRKRSAFPKLTDVLRWPTKKSNGRVDSLPAGASRIPGTVEAVLTLAPGDDFEVDVWCIPCEADLSCLFAVVESIGSIAIARATNGDNSEFLRHVCDELHKLLPAAVCADIEKCLAKKDEAAADWNLGCAGPGALTAPGPESLLAIAHALYSVLEKRPLDEISAVRTLRATHAVSHPALTPMICRPLAPEQKSGAKSFDDEIVTLTRESASQKVRDAFSFTATGDVLIHLPTTSSLEISAEVASPTSDRFDDERRARPLTDRGCPWSNTAVAKKVFGFDVDSAGNVSLPRTEVVLHRLDDIPAPNDTCSDSDGVHRIALADILSHSEPDKYQGTRKPTHQFSDGKARLLNLRVISYARHGDQMRTASKLASSGHWLRDGMALPDDACKVSAPVSAWLPAAVRPAEPVARTPVPAFLWTLQSTQKKIEQGENLPAGSTDGDPYSPRASMVFFR